MIILLPITNPHRISPPGLTPPYRGTSLIRNSAPLTPTEYLRQALRLRVGQEISDFSKIAERLQHLHYLPNSPGDLAGNYFRSSSSSLLLSSLELSDTKVYEP